MSDDKKTDDSPKTTRRKRLTKIPVRVEIARGVDAHLKPIGRLINALSYPWPFISPADVRYAVDGGTVLIALADKDMPNITLGDDETSIKEGMVLGFNISNPEVRSGHYHLLSRLSVVHDDLIDRGIGTTIKMEQMRLAQSLGMDYLHWTTHPTLSRNAWVWAMHCGARAYGFNQNMFGRKVAGHPDTDRLLWEWNIPRDSHYNDHWPSQYPQVSLPKYNADQELILLQDGVMSNPYADIGKFAERQDYFWVTAPRYWDRFGSSTTYKKSAKNWRNCFRTVMGRLFETPGEYHIVAMWRNQKDNPTDWENSVVRYLAVKSGSEFYKTNVILEV